MSPLNIFLPGWTALPNAIPDEPLTQDPPVSEDTEWSADAANDAAEPRYTEYCDKKYDQETQSVATHSVAETAPRGWSYV